jgi:hypothetical protein
VSVPRVFSVCDSTNVVTSLISNDPVQFSEPSHHFVRCVCFNAHSLPSSLSELDYLRYHDGYGIVVVVDTWLGPDITDAMFDPEHRYSIYQYD